MKKKKEGKKLLLSRETLKLLTSSDTQKIVGGAAGEPDTETTSCITKSIKPCAC
jgi:hypothetical protein